MLPDGRLHLNEGPIDLVIAAEGDAVSVHTAFAKAAHRFDGLLSALAGELPALRSSVTDFGPILHHPVARRMLSATRPHRATFVTPMAAVAGAVADEILAAMTKTPGLSKAYVNNGGDIAIYLTANQEFTIGAMSRLSVTKPDGFVTLTSNDHVGGVATSGAEGRSFSLGIADSVAVLARNAAVADVAATLICNAVNLDHSAIKRVPATSLDPDSDLGERLVTASVGDLSPAAISIALNRGAVSARSMVGRNLISGAMLRLRDQIRLIGNISALPTRNKE